jgi:hypothetical protein
MQKGEPMSDLISRQIAIDELWKALYKYEDETEKQFQDSDELDIGDWMSHRIFVQNMSDIDRQTILNLPSVQLDLGKYEYHYDHTDCIWYRPEARNRCPTTCAQYRDGWNDAMNYIFRDGKGYRPYRRDTNYGE